MIKNFLFKLYKIDNDRFRHQIHRIVSALEKGELYSLTLRKIFNHYHKVKIGLYSMGGCFSPYSIDKFTSFGRYCSIAEGVRIFNRNHPLEFKSMHGFFFNPVLGYVNEDRIEYIPLEIGHDVWIGAGATIMPNVNKIATGAVVAAGAVVNKNLPPYSVAVGNPARVVRFRFSPETIERLLESKWWEKSMDELTGEIDTFQRTLEHASESISI